MGGKKTEGEVMEEVGREGRIKSDAAYQASCRRLCASYRAKVTIDCLQKVVLWWIH